MTEINILKDIVDTLHNKEKTSEHVFKSVYEKIKEENTHFFNIIQKYETIGMRKIFFGFPDELKFQDQCDIPDSFYTENEESILRLKELRDELI